MREPKTYRGIPCKQRHGGRRYIASNVCVECQQERDARRLARKRAADEMHSVEAHPA